MTASFDTPIVVVLFNRSARIRELIGVLRRIRPARILAIADGPRESPAGDRAACASARAVLDTIDWPCVIEREFASTNLGCDRRVASGLDWAFSRVDRAIVLEDDILPDQSFFPWAAAMLDRFGNDPGVAMISGRNPLGCWGDGLQDHVRTRRGSNWGWATTARAWQRTNACNLAGDPADADHDASRPGADPLLATRFGLMLRSYRNGTLTAWDTTFELQNFMLGGAAMVSPVNLVQHNGIGPDATHPRFADDFGALIPVGTAPAPVASGESSFNAAFDRAALLVELLSGCIDPPMAHRLAVRLSLGTTLTLDDATRHHLAPFAVPGESLGLLEHLGAQGVASPHFECLLRTLRQDTPAKREHP